MDLSDGLGDAVRQLAEASGVGMTVNAADLPIADAVRAWHLGTGRDVMATAISAGDDYELLFTITAGSARTASECAPVCRRSADNPDRRGDEGARRAAARRARHT